MFIDNVSLTLSSGKGGAGCSSFRREKFVIKGGPDGGDGGKGGDVYFLVDKNSHTLSKYRGQNHIKAKNGRQGEGRKKHGKSGETLILTVPPGTQVVDEETNEIILDLVEDGQKELFLEGGKGGLGNWHFRSSTNQTPSYSQPGLPGLTKEIRLELKLIADVGLVGFPNVGKSTLISTISNAKPEIANYEFTTLTPKLGVVEVDYDKSFVMADIPGIIEGASDGKGLGLEFLKHIQRTKFLLYMVDLAHYKTLEEQFETLKKELENYSDILAKNDFAIALTRADSLSLEEVNQKASDFIEYLSLKPNVNKSLNQDFVSYSQNDEFAKKDYTKPLFVIPISSVIHKNINELKYLLSDTLK